MNVKQDYLEQVESAWEELIEVLSNCDESQLSLPGASGDWSPKDVMAHITWYEREMIGVLEKRALVGSNLWNDSTDERNRQVYEASKDRPLAEIHAEFLRTHANLWALLQNITDEELITPSKFTAMPPNWIPVEVLAGNTSTHYREHAQLLRDWLAKQLDR